MPPLIYFVTSHFYPRSPRGERLPAGRFNGVGTTFLSTLPARGATQALKYTVKMSWISIHAPREGSDRNKLVLTVVSEHFYPRSPRGERRQSSAQHDAARKNFYPRSPRGERPSGPTAVDTAQNFYPRSPRGERLLNMMSAGTAHLIFLSTLPARGATRNSRPAGLPTGYFYPRSPRGERPPFRPSWPTWDDNFYPRSPRGERPKVERPREDAPDISIHAPREGSDPQVCGRCFRYLPISIHAPREGSDLNMMSAGTANLIFLSTLPARGATANVLKNKRLPSAAFV